MTDYTQYKQDNFFGFQVDWPVFVKRGFNMFGKDWKPGEEFNWVTYPCRKEDQHKLKTRIKILYDTGRIHHDSAREIQQKVGDRLGELTVTDLGKMVRMLNVYIKEQTTTTAEFQNKRVKTSKLHDKQRGILRAWINRNQWAFDEYNRVKEQLLEEANNRKLETTDD